MGVFGMMLTRELEHPSDKPDIFTDSNGLATTEKISVVEGVTGNYINSENIEGNDCWGKRSNWVNLRSNIGDEKISLAILDHTSNAGYPTYWHTRGYGLFAANPLGQEVFSDGKEALNLSLDQGEDITFKHRIIVASKNLEKTQLDSEFDKFSNQ